MTDLPEGFEKYLCDKYKMNSSTFKLLYENKYNSDLEAYTAGIAQGRRERAESVKLRKEVQKQETLKDWARVDADEAEKAIDALKTSLAEYRYTPQAYDEMWDRLIKAVNENDELKAQLEKSINNQETDSN